MAAFSKLPTKKRGGPSVFEVFVVIAVIGVISVASFLLLDDGRKDSRNTARASQLKEYMKAFEYYYSENGSYPTFSDNATRTACLGDYAGNTCWKDSAVTESETLNNLLTPAYMRKLPRGETRMFGIEPGVSSGYSGIVYEYNNEGSSYSLFYFMEGRDHDCVFQGAVGENVGEDTHCYFSFTP